MEIREVWYLFWTPKAFSVFWKTRETNHKKENPLKSPSCKTFQQRKNPSAQQKHVEFDFPKFPWKHWTSPSTKFTFCGPWRLHQRYGPWRHHPLQYPQSSPDHRIISIRINWSTRIFLKPINRPCMEGEQLTTYNPILFGTKSIACLIIISTWQHQRNISVTPTGTFNLSLWKTKVHLHQSDMWHQFRKVA